MIEFLLSQRAWWVAVCAELGLTPMQGHAVRVLDPERPVAMSTLADALVCDASNVTGIVDKLESRGLIARQGAEHDRRIKMLAVTDKGRRLREQLWARTLEPPVAVAALSADKRRQLADIVRAIID
jgi:DNA-binding MarR family transcriptional regulator